MSFPRKVALRCSYALTMAFSLACFSCGDCVETPKVTSITPASATAGSSGLVLVVNGNDFQRNSSVNWNGTARPTTFVNSHQLQATITAADIAEPAAAKVTVFSPPQTQRVTFGSTATSSATSSVKMDCVGGTSNVLLFTVHP